MSKGKLKGVNKQRLQIAKRKVKRRWVTSIFGAEVDIGERTVGSKLDAMISEGPKGGDEKGGVVIKLGVVGDGS